jgi:hypothetical protein
MVRLVVATVVLVALATTGRATADPMRKVLIETEPAGAVVYLNAKEDGVACQPTPCEVNAPVGETPMIIEKDGFAPVIDSLVVARGGRAPKVKFTLEATSGTLDVSVTGTSDAMVKVDGKTKGKAPGQIVVDSGTHHVVVISGDKTLYDDTVAVDPGETAQIKAVMPDAVPGPPPHDPTENPLGTEKTGGDVTTTGPGPERPPFITVSAAFDVGFRQFNYTNPQMPMTGPDNVGSDSEGGQLLAGPVVEFFPMRAFGVDFLPNLSLYGRVEFGLNQQAVLAPNIIMDTPPTSFWRSYEVSLRNRWIVGDSVGIDAIAGYTQDQYEFSGNGSDIALIPDANYQSVEIGARGTLMTSTLDPYIEVANRIVLSGGQEQTRFIQASANGLHAALGIAAHFGKIRAKVGGEITSYSWTFSNNGQPGKGYSATGAVDTIELISISVGYAY